MEESDKEKVEEIADLKRLVREKRVDYNLALLNAYEYYEYKVCGYYL